MSADHKTIYFARIVTDSKIHVATRADTTVPFGAATELSPVNTKKVARAYVARRPR